MIRYTAQILGLVTALLVASPGLTWADSPTKVASSLEVISGAVLAQTEAPTEAAAAPTETAAEPTIEQRVAGLEAYMNNVDPAGSKVAGIPGPGHNAWMMVSAALVIFMTLPGLALFYGGLVRSKNVLSVLAQCLGITGMVTILWWAVGYSLVFGTNFGSPFLGGTEFFFFKDVTAAPNTNYAYWVSQSVFSIFQLSFAIITPSLIIGAIAERMKFSALMVFIGAWMFMVYFPLAHMVWGATGLMNGVWNADAAIPAIDFAGGTVVHMSSGWSALILCMMLGKREGFGKVPMPPHNMVLCMVGTGMLWVGWYGFNAGSAAAADGVAANAFMTTTLAAAVASFTWAVLEFLFKQRTSVLGFCSGVIAGLVVITPAAGFVDATGAVLIGLFAGIIPFFAVVKLKEMLGYDDALDTFGIHAVGGTLGAILTGIFVNPAVNSNLVSEGYAKKNGLYELVTNGGLVFVQLQAVLITVVISVVCTAIIAFIIKALMGLRPTVEEEQEGLDTTDHGEKGYLL
jgi:ammonium transporter, Amt family